MSGAFLTCESVLIVVIVVGLLAHSLIYASTQSSSQTGTVGADSTSTTHETYDGELCYGINGLRSQLTPRDKEKRSLRTGIR